MHELLQFPTRMTSSLSLQGWRRTLFRPSSRHFYKAFHNMICSRHLDYETKKRFEMFKPSQHIHPKTRPIPGVGQSGMNRKTYPLKTIPPPTREHPTRTQHPRKSNIARHQDLLTLMDVHSGDDPLDNFMRTQLWGEESEERGWDSCLGCIIRWVWIHFSLGDVMRWDEKKKK